mgnify:CR=1 FL=1
MAMVQTKRLAALLLALLLTLFLLPSAWADSGVVGGTTVSGTVRVYLSSISSLTAVDVSIAGSYSVGGDASRALARGQNIRVSNSGGTLMMTADGQTQTMGSRFKLRRHQTSGENGVRIAGTLPGEPVSGRYRVYRQGRQRADHRPCVYGGLHARRAAV